MTANTLNPTASSTMIGFSKRRSRQLSTNAIRPPGGQREVAPVAKRRGWYRNDEHVADNPAAQRRHHGQGDDADHVQARGTYRRQRPVQSEHEGPEQVQSKQQRRFG
jgi:hypothetical protein